MSLNFDLNCNGGVLLLLSSFILLFISITVVWRNGNEMHHYSVFQRIFHLSFRANTFSVLLFECKKLDAHSVRNLIFLAYIRLRILNSLPANYNLLSLHSKHDLFRDVNKICYPQNSFGFYLYSDAKFIYDKLSISFFSRFIRIVRKYN